MKRRDDKRQKKLIQLDNSRKRNGNWVGYRPSSMPMKTEYKRKGRRVKERFYDRER